MYNLEPSNISDSKPAQFIGYLFRFVFVCFFIFEDTTLEKAIKKHNSELSEDRERKKLISFKHTMNTYKLFLGPSDNSENGVAS